MKIGYARVSTAEQQQRSDVASRLAVWGLHGLPVRGITPSVKVPFGVI